MKECKLPTGDWKVDIETYEEYLTLMDTGLLWEMYPTIPDTWRECLQVKFNQVTKLNLNIEEEDLPWLEEYFTKKKKEIPVEFPVRFRRCNVD